MEIEKVLTWRARRQLVVTLWSAIVIAIGGFFGVVNAVSGQTDTPEPTATDTPTPTMTQAGGDFIGTPGLNLSVYDFTCPVGTPIGYGTVTPDALWNMGCAQCFQGDGSYGTPTQPPSATPAALLLVSDHFTDEDGTGLDEHTPDVDHAGNGWVEVNGVWEIDTNQLKENAGTSKNAVIDTEVSDVRIGAELKAIAGDPGLIGRWVDTSNYWVLITNDFTNELKLWRHLAGGWSNPGNAGHVWVGDEFVELWMQGETIKAWIDGDLKFTVIDSTHETATKHGFFSSIGMATVRWDDLVINGFLINPTPTPTATVGPEFFTRGPVDIYMDAQDQQTGLGIGSFVEGDGGLVAFGHVISFQENANPAMSDPEVGNIFNTGGSQGPESTGVLYCRWTGLGADDDGCEFLAAHLGLSWTVQNGVAASAYFDYEEGVEVTIGMSAWNQGTPPFYPEASSIRLKAYPVYYGFGESGEGGEFYGSYCDEVQSIEEEEEAFGWTGIIYGSTECVDVGPYEASLFGFEWGIPHVLHLCFRSVSLGQLTVFGVLIMMDVMLLAMAAVVVIRLFT